MSPDPYFDLGRFSTDFKEAARNFSDTLALTRMRFSLYNSNLFQLTDLIEYFNSMQCVINPQNSLLLDTFRAIEKQIYNISIAYCHINDENYEFEEVPSSTSSYIQTLAKTVRKNIHENEYQVFDLLRPNICNNDRYDRIFELFTSEVVNPSEFSKSAYQILKACGDTKGAIEISKKLSNFAKS